MNNVETIKVVPARYPLRTLGAVVALFVLAVVVQSVAFNPRWEWAVFAHWFFDPVILEGVGQTLLLTLIVVVAQWPRVGLYLAIPLATADCGADYSL